MRRWPRVAKAKGAHRFQSDICNIGLVRCLNKFYNMRRWQSGQLHLTVNQTPSGYGGSNPSRRTNITKNEGLPSFFVIFVLLNFFGNFLFLIFYKNFPIFNRDKNSITFLYPFSNYEHSYWVQYFFLNQSR